MYLQQNKKFDWLFIVDPIWLVWNTYISHSPTHSPTHSPFDSFITYPMCQLRGIFLQKNNPKSDWWIVIDDPKQMDAP